MKLARYGAGAGTRAGVVREDGLVDLAPLGYGDLLSIIRDGEAALARIADHAASATAQPLSSVRLLAPIERPGKYLAIGMNYRKHVEERSEEHTSELQSLMRISYAVFCLK